MAERSLEIFKASQAAWDKFDYFVCGVAGAMFAYGAQTPSPVFTGFGFHFQFDLFQRRQRRRGQRHSHFHKASWVVVARATGFYSLIIPTTSRCAVKGEKHRDNHPLTPLAKYVPILRLD
jgi:hypothetical protein